MSYQNKIKNAMLSSYLKIKTYMKTSKGNMNAKNYLDILSSYVSKQTVKKIQEGIDANKSTNNLVQNNSHHSESANLFSIPEISFVQNATTVRQFINELQKVKTDSNYAAIAASALAVLAGLGGIFFPPLEIVATIAGLAAFACSTISFSVGCAIDSLEEEIGENPNLTSTIISGTAVGTKVGLTATKVVALLNQNLSSLESWLDDVLYLGDLISLIFQVVNAIGQN